MKTPTIFPDYTGYYTGLFDIDILQHSEDLIKVIKSIESMVDYEEVFNRLQRPSVDALIDLSAELKGRLVACTAELTREEEPEGEPKGLRVVPH